MQRYYNLPFISALFRNNTEKFPDLYEDMDFHDLKTSICQMIPRGIKYTEDIYSLTYADTFLCHCKVTSHVSP